MRSVWKGLLAISFLVGAAHGAYAGCGAQPGDDAAVLAARQAARTACPCAAAANHGAYVSCVAGVANDRSSLPSSDPNFLPRNCKGAVKKCAARSVCGKPDAVTCCITKGTVTKCKTKKDAMHCSDAGGTPTGTSSTGCSSCCDACPAPGSGPSCSPSGAFLE